MFKRRLIAFMIIFIAEGCLFYDGYESNPFKKDNKTEDVHDDYLDEDDEVYDYSYSSNKKTFDINENGLTYMPYSTNDRDEYYLLVKNGYVFAIHYNPYVLNKSPLYDEEGFNGITLGEYGTDGSSVIIYLYPVDPNLKTEVGNYDGNVNQDALKVYKKLLSNNNFTREQLIRWVKDYVLEHRNEAIDQWNENDCPYLSDK